MIYENRSAGEAVGRSENNNEALQKNIFQSANAILMSNNLKQYLISE